MTKSSRIRAIKPSTPVIVVGSLLVALGLTAVGDTQAQAQRRAPRSHSRLTVTHDATELRILDWALWNVSKYYVEKKRIDPDAMTLAALEALESTVPEVLVQPVASGKRVRVRVGTEEQEFQVGDIEALWAVGTHVREVFRFVNQHTKLSDKDQRRAEYAIVAGALSTLDPHTNLLRPDDFEDMKASTKGSFGGLGIEVGMREGVITVIRVLDGNPASKVDMRAGDRIVQIDDQSTVTMNLNEAVQLLRGAPGTAVTVYVLRGSLDRPKPLKITRATIQLDSVVGEVIESTDGAGKTRKVGLVQIPRNFAQTTGKELRAKLGEFEKQAVEGIILDLRDNPGGLLNAAVEVADAFLSAGTIVATVGNASPREENRADDRYNFPDTPLVVLIDQGSASASEIVAGALRNLGRAVVIGRRTFGKGSVQVLHERKVEDKELALKLTIAQYLTPGDISIQSVGVSPDLETIPVYLGKEHVSFFGRERFDLLREESLTAHLEGGAQRAQSITAGPLYFLARDSVEDENGKGKKGDKKKPDAVPFIVKDDPEIRVARDLLLWAQSSKREALLSDLDDFFAQQSKIEQERISKALATRKIDWSPGPPPVGDKAAKLRVSVKTDKAKNVIRGGQKGVVTVSVTNEGDATAYKVRAITDSDYRYFDERELLFGRIDAGATKTYSIKLSVSEHELSRSDRIDFHLFEQHGAKLAKGSQRSIDVSAEGLQRPQFAYGYQILDDPSSGKQVSGNGDGALQLGERAKLRVTVKNVGEGPALDTWVSLRNLSGDAVFLHSGRERLKEMKPGESRVVELDLELRKPPKDGEARLQLTVSDNKIAEVLSEKVVFPVQSKSLTFSKGDPSVKASAAIDLYASPMGPKRVVAHAKPGALFPATARVDGWYRVKLGDGVFAFARADQLQGSQRKVSRPGAYEPVLAVTPPRIKLVGTMTQTDQKKIHLSGAAEDQQAVRDVYVTVYNPARNLLGDREKVFYQAAKNPASGRLEFAADIPLTPGNNLIEVHARENDEVIGIRRMWVLRTSGLAEARAKEAKFSSNGKLRVDTFK